MSPEYLIMERRNIVRQKIQRAFVQIVTSVKLANKLNFTDLNIVAEDFFKELFNLIYDYKIKNANAIRQNESTIDLFYEHEGIAYQITSQNKKEKIAKTVDGFIREERYTAYSKLIIFSITAENKCKSDALDRLEEFNVEGLCINVSDLEKEILFELESSRLEVIADFLEYETNPHLKKRTVNQNEADEALTSLHIVDQIHTVLHRFDGFVMIHPRTLSRIYPFNLREKICDSYSNYCLKTNNKAIHELLTKVKVNHDHQIEISDAELLPYEDKLKDIFLRLNHSLVYCICYREKYEEIEHHGISLLKYDEACECNQCRYQRFNTRPLFDLLKEKSIAPSENLTEALSEGYYLCKLGEHIRGWQVFDSVAEQSLQQNNNVTYFIAQHNSLAIHNFIESPWWENESKAILPKIRKIDLHSILCSLEVAVEVRDELVRVKEDYHLNYSREKIEEYAETIRHIKVRYENKGFSSGSSVLKLLRQEIFLLFRFYSSNAIISDDFFPFRATMTKGIDALFNSYTTDARYQYRHTGFDSFTLMMMIFYVEEDAIKRIFKTYKITGIEIAEKEAERFVGTVANFFTSQYTDTWSEPKFSADLKRQDYFSRYRQSLRHMFVRVMLILSKLTLTIEQCKPLTGPFVRFLRAGDDMNHMSWESVVPFLDKYIAAFSIQQIKSIIETVVSEKRHHSGDDVLQAICESAAKAGFVSDDPDFFTEILDGVSKPCRKCKRIHDMTQILAVWSIADQAGRGLIRQQATGYLQKMFDADFYQDAVFSGVLTKDDSPAFLSAYIQHANTHCNRHDIREENGHWIFQSYIGYNCINCLLYMEADFSRTDIQELAAKSEYYNWLVNHEHYDYTNFEFKWLTDACPYYLRVNLWKLKALKKELEKHLSGHYDEGLAKFFVRYFLTSEYQHV